MDLINHINFGSNFVWPIKPSNSDPIQNTAIYTKKNREVLGKEGCSF